MQLAVFSENKTKEIEKLIKLMDEVNNWDYDWASEEEQADLRAVLHQLDGMRHTISHLLFAYETLYNNCCDPTLDYLEFKPEIKKLMEGEDNG